MDIYVLKPANTDMALKKIQNVHWKIHIQQKLETGKDISWKAPDYLTKNVPLLKKKKLHFLAAGGQTPRPPLAECLVKNASCFFYLLP